MKKLKDMTNEEKFDVMLEIYDIYSEIMADKEVNNALKSGDAKTILKAIIDNQRENAIKLCAAREGVPVEQYHVGVMTLPNVLSEIIMDGNTDFFVEQEQKDE